MCWPVAPTAKAACGLVIAFTGRFARDSVPRWQTEVRRAMSHAETFFKQVGEIAAQIDRGAIERLAQELKGLRDRGGRLFLLGVGGSAGNCSHAVNDFRKLCGIEAYAPVDNVSELTARANDEGWETIFTGWLEISRADAKDAILVFSVGGGDAERNVSMNIV
jgi:D-sedoheptulose 7-phosphate isomerase